MWLLFQPLLLKVARSYLRASQETLEASPALLRHPQWITLNILKLERCWANTTQGHTQQVVYVYILKVGLGAVATLLSLRDSAEIQNLRPSPRPI